MEVHCLPQSPHQLSQDHLHQHYWQQSLQQQAVLELGLGPSKMSKNKLIYKHYIIYFQSINNELLSLIFISMDIESTIESKLLSMIYEVPDVEAPQELCLQEYHL